MKKQGISLIALIVTLILIIIILSVSTAGIGNAIQNSRKTAFGEELTKIEDAIDVYYIQNGEFPILLENEKYVSYMYNNTSLDAVGGATIALNSNYINEFKDELVKNLDLSDGENIVSDTVFYKIDLSKLGVEKITRGTGEDGENDIFVMAYPSQNLYYIKGIVADKIPYFSLANISNVKKNDNANIENTVQSLAGVTVTKAKKAWTNTLGITVSANLTDGETLYVKLPIKDEIQLSTAVGDNNISINSLNVSLGLTEEEITNFNNLELSNKYMNVIKKKNGIETANIRVSLANYEVETPTFPLKADGATFDFKVESFEGYNKVSYKGIDNISGIKEVRYEYLTEFDSNGGIKTLNSNTSSLTPEYMLENGKKAYVSNDGNVEIKLPKDIEAIYITMFDRAGNSVSMQKNVQTDLYVGIFPTNISSKLKFNVVIKSSTAISSNNVSISLDGKNYIDQKNLNLTNLSQGIYNSTVEFENVKEKIVYVKAVVINSSSPQVTETRIKKIDLTETASLQVSSAVPGIIYEENRYYTDKNGDVAIVPAGFTVSSKAIEQVIDDGLVIIDKYDNEFVWVPCTIDGANGSIKYMKRFTEYPKLDGITSSTDDINALPMKDSTTRINEKDQISQYGGFYIGRYESGVPENQTTIDSKSLATSDVAGIPVVKKGAIVWTYISYNKAMPNAKKIHENSTSVRSGIMTASQWDTACAWISSELDNTSKPIHNVISSVSWANHTDTIGNAQYDIDGKTKISGVKQVTGKSEYWKAKNIYDFAGNVWELTGENYNSTNKLIRGGGYNNSNTSSSAAYRWDVGNDFGNANISFRIVLYVM